MSLRQTVPPSRSVVEYTDLAAQLRIGGSDEGVLLSELLGVATRHCEALTWRQFLTATWVYKLDRFPCERELYIPRPRLQATDFSVQYVDGNGVTQTWDSEDYQLDTDTEPGRLSPAYGTTWPTTRCVLNAVRITFKAGYGDPEHVPAPIHHAIKILAGFLFENRGVDASQAPPAVWHLLDPYDAHDPRIVDQEIES